MSQFTTKIRLRNLYWLSLAIAVLIADRISKDLITHYFSLHESKRLLPVLSLARWHNTGAAFSFLQGDSGWQVWFFSAVAIGISLAIIWWLVTLPAKRIWLSCGLMLILGGALGNLWDRLLYGYVIDLILVHWGHWQFPVFNLADAAITLGALMLAYRIFRQSTKTLV